MFSGSWKESNMSFIALDIPDLNITVEGTFIDCEFKKSNLIFHFH